MFWFSPFTIKILSYYRTILELVDTIPMGFTGALGERPPIVPSNEISEDALYFAAAVNFNLSTPLVRIKSNSPQYDWMADDNATPQDTPINAIAGVFSQALPVLPLIQPFFVKKQGRLQHQFTNAVAPEAAVTGGLWTWRGLRLSNPYDGFGWDYSIGYAL